jgi:hypothetical protein
MLGDTPVRPDLARPYEFKYVAEVKLLRWGESNKGATVTLELPPIPIGEGHPFKGLDGQRFRMHFEVLVDDAPEPERVPVPPPDPELQRGPAKSEKARANYQAMDEMEQARVRSVMLCKELKFRQWLSLRDPPMTEDEAAGELCAIIGVYTRREIATSERAFLAFRKLEDAYHLETKYAENLR